MITPSFITAKCSSRNTSRFPVTVMKTSPTFAASAIGITRKPCIIASSAFVGSISVMITSAPIPLARSATPFPQYPKPATTTIRPASKKFVARNTASRVDCPVP